MRAEASWIRTNDLTLNTRESALDFLTAKTARLPRRLETRGQKDFSISKSGEMEGSA